jgi:hypothetical protein
VEKVRDRVGLCLSPPERALALCVDEKAQGLAFDRALKGSVFRSVSEIEQAIQDYVQATNEDSKPFRWTKTADDILASIQPFCLRTSDARQ